MKKRESKIEDGGWRLIVLALCFCLLPSYFCLSAWGQQYSINWFKVAGGGGTSTGGTYQVSGTIGQHDAGGAMANNQYSITGGFWAIITVIQTPGAPLLSLSHSGNSVIISWPSSATNYALQQNSNLNTANWINSGLSITTNGATESVTINPPVGNLFFRLKQ